MTEGNPLRRMLVFGAPVMAGGILQQMYNMADAVIAGSKQTKLSIYSCHDTSILRSTLKWG